ncbi:MAG: transcriptional regulator GcvA [Pseudomonadota bacterium]
MPSRLPPLTALRAFEAAARHLSFAKAADELGVTPAALSFQIKSLEDHLGRPVFRRLNRAVELTEAGRALAPGLSDGFGALAAAWRAALRVTDTTTLTVTAGPAFTAKWLAPRLFDFASKHPEIELRFAASLKLADFERDQVDVAIRFGFDTAPGFYARPILSDWMSPMMAPALAEKIRTPADLQHATLLHQDDLTNLLPDLTWSTWFRLSGLGPAPRSGPRFSQADHALDAALAGTGVVLGRSSLAAGDLAEGRLVAPFELGLTMGARYRVVFPQANGARPQVAAFRDWVEHEADLAMQAVPTPSRLVSLEDL